MSDGAESLSLSVPDDGRSYARGMRARVDRTVHPPDVLPDRRGDYEVDDWWPEAQGGGLPFSGPLSSIVDGR